MGPRDSRYVWTEIVNCESIVKMGLMFHKSLLQALNLSIYPDGTPGHEVFLNISDPLNYIGGLGCPISQVCGHSFPNSSLWIQLEIS